ncbi:MAG: LysE family transporter [Desulfobacterales bacterium]|jgi:threonine/homoserine/homoserine lactone efflux protein|nr:LysE family transporter [Desulfobacteraceae bacterium]MBT7086282.1 LysE family transporter [Desulfobacterales bacterium]MBT7697416.1 LysE family transporter [Desulfobacterales bacterium]
MPNDIINTFSSFWSVLSFSFLVALTGAMSPGPLLTYTIIKSVKTERRGYLMGLWIIVGHALLEMVIIILMLLGFSFILKNVFIVRFIGITGGIILIYLGLSIIRDVYKGKIQTGFLDSSNEPDQRGDIDENSLLENPVMGGILVSMANPYWWVWWATIGLAFMIQFDVSFKQWPKLLAFFIGHEAGDLAWYLLISILAFFGLRHLNKKVYYVILIFCGIFMIFFGLYLGITPLFRDIT